VVNDLPNPAGLRGQCGSTFDELGIIQPLHPVGQKHKHERTSDEGYISEGRWRGESQKETQQPKNACYQRQHNHHTPLCQTDSQQSVGDMPGIRRGNGHTPQPTTQDGQ
jgi:hypothetical protein